MATAQEKMTGNVSKDNPANKAVEKEEFDKHVSKIDRSAPAGSENSLGEESVRDGRPATDDSVVEAIDEEGPEITTGTLP